MASYLQVENISKSYGTKVLFDNISFNINEGDKIALIAPNGTGKTSLLSILAGKDSSDRGGEVKFLKDITISFLEQESCFPADESIYEVVADAVEEVAVVRNHEQCATGTGEHLLKIFNCLQVEMVCRLVHYQKVWLCNEHGCNGNPLYLSTA